MVLKQFSMRSWKGFLLPALLILIFMLGTAYLTNSFLSQRDRNQLNEFGSQISSLINQKVSNINSDILLASRQFEEKNNFDQLSIRLIKNNPSILMIELWTNEKKLLKNFINKKNQIAIAVRNNYPLWSENYFQKAIEQERPLFALPTKVTTGSVDEFLSGNLIELIVPLRNKTTLVLLLDTTAWMNMSGIENLVTLNSLSVELVDNFGGTIFSAGPNLSKLDDVYQISYTSVINDLELTLKVSKLNLYSQTNRWIATLVGILFGLFALLVLFVLYSYRLQSDFLNRVRLQEVTILDQAKYSTLGEISTIISHEINQPLSAIEIYASTALKKLDKDHLDIFEIKRLIEQAKGEVRRISQIISGVRKFVTSSNSMQEGYVSSRQIMNNLREILVLQAKRYECNFVLQHNHSFKLKIDPILLEQVVLNLARNAFEAMNSNGVSQKLLTITVRYSDRKGFIEFHDTGPGISEESQSKIGTPFFSTKPDSVGMGISLCKSLMERYNGTIQWHNSPYVGAIFTISFFDVVADV